MRRGSLEQPGRRPSEVPMRRGSLPANLPANLQDLGYRKLPAAFQKTVKRRALEQLHGQERYAAIFADLVNGHDVIAPELGGRPGFPQEALFGRGVGSDPRAVGRSCPALAIASNMCTAFWSIEVATAAFR